MQKKVIAFITSLCIVITCSVPSFAIDIATSSAISLPSSRFSLQANNTPVGALAATSSTVVAPESSSATKWYINNNGLVTSATTTITTWGNMVTQITDSIAQSLYRVVVSTNNVYSALNSYLISNNTTSYYTWSWSESDGVTQGAPNGSQSAIVALRNYGSALTKLFSQNIEQTYQIRSLLQNGVGYDTVKIANNPDNGFSKSYLWGKYAPMDNATSFNWFNGRSKIVSNFDYKNSPLLGSFFYHFRTQMTSFNNLAVNLVGAIGSYSLTNDDLTTTSFGSDTSIANDIRNIGSNLSGPLHRLAFVLASQEEIEARQSASDNQTAVINNFIKPSGSGSASAADIGGLANVSSSMSDMLGSDISPSTAFSSMSSDSDAWSWFSQDTADYLDQRTSTRRLLKGSNKSFVSDYYKELESIIGVKLW